MFIEDIWKIRKLLMAIREDNVNAAKEMIHNSKGELFILSINRIEQNILTAAIGTRSIEMIMMILNIYKVYPKYDIVNHVSDKQGSTALDMVMMLATTTQEMDIILALLQAGAKHVSENVLTTVLNPNYQHVSIIAQMIQVVMYSASFIKVQTMLLRVLIQHFADSIPDMLMAGVDPTGLTIKGRNNKVPWKSVAMSHTYGQVVVNIPHHVLTSLIQSANSRQALQLLYKYSLSAKIRVLTERTSEQHYDNDSQCKQACRLNLQLMIQCGFTPTDGTELSHFTSFFKANKLPSLSLKHISRLAIRNSLHRNVLFAMSQLILPQSIKDYLIFKDLTDINSLLE